VQAGVRELHLRLDTGGTGDPAAGGAVDKELEQRGLADPGLSAQYEGPATAGLHGRDEAGERLALASSSDQTRPQSKVGVTTTAQRSSPPHGYPSWAPSAAGGHRTTSSASITEATDAGGQAIPPLAR
jgi:hypothetical protein